MRHIKLHHFTILYVAIILIGIISLDIKTNEFTAVLQEKEWLDQSFNKAIDDASILLVKADGSEGLTIDKEKAVDGFFRSMYSSLNIIDNPDKQTTFQNYTPVIAATTNEGYYLHYTDEYKGIDNKTYYSKRWTELMPYYYEDNDFVYSFTLTEILTVYDKNSLLDTSGELKFFTLNYHDFASDEQFHEFRAQRPNSFLLNDELYHNVRKTAIVSSLEKSLSYYSNRHNNIARHYGISYNFTMPIIDNSVWSRSIDNPSIIVIFQGYPYGTGLKTSYNRFHIAGSQVEKKVVYFLEQKSWYYIYHREDCPELENGLTVLTEPYYSEYEVIAKGAYACPICNTIGVIAPDYDIANQDILSYSINDWDSDKLNKLWGINKLYLYTESGNLIGTVNGLDPFFSITYQIPNTEYVDSVMVYARITGSSTPVSQLFFSSADNNYTEAMSVRTNINTNGEWQWIKFDVSSNSNWKGSISNFRFDLIADESTSGKIEIAEIKFVGR